MNNEQFSGNMPTQGQASGRAVGDSSVFLRIQDLKQGKIQFTDTSNAVRLYERHGADIRYNAAWKKWLVWTGRKWQLDEGPLIHEKSLEVIHSIYDELAHTSDYRDRIEIERQGMKAESWRRRKAFVEAASAITALNISANDVDVNPWLLNVKNGTVDLTTGEFQDHKREDMITKMANVEYDPAADCPQWKQFIREIMDFRPDLIAFLQVAAGWAVTGDTSEQCMFILFGSGANGKSTFLNTLMKILGDYAISASTETFMKKNSEMISNDIARLRGTRFVATAEAEQGKRLSETLIKQITGNDSMTARFLYGEYFDFIPTFKIFMATNHKPLIKGTDYGIWRRIKLIPFETTIPPDKRDKHLEEKLLAEAPGILNWLIEGAKVWHELGLHEPQSISDANEEYKDEMDVIGNFIKECCVQGDEYKAKIKELYRAYKDWCLENNERVCSERYLTLRLKELGLCQARTADARFWTGIGIKITDSMNVN
jgi:putative DNA primase/helicase